MKKLLVVCVLIVTTSIASRAQDGGGGFSFGAGVNLALPIGDFSNTHSFGVGVEAQGEYAFSDMFSAVFNTGYTQFFGKSETVFGTTIEYDGVGLIPVLAGARVYPSPMIFIGARAGLGVLTGNNDSETGFVYRPEVGGTVGPVQLALSYNGFSKDGNSIGHVGLTVIYRFGQSVE
jgi:hypothetical protein